MVFDIFSIENLKFKKYENKAYITPFGMEMHDLFSSRFSKLMVFKDLVLVSMQVFRVL
jgi:hypothetical protein